MIIYPPSITSSYSASVSSSCSLSIVLLLNPGLNKPLVIPPFCFFSSDFFALLSLIDSIEIYCRLFFRFLANFVLLVSYGFTVHTTIYISYLTINLSTWGLPKSSSGKLKTSYILFVDSLNDVTWRQSSMKLQSFAFNSISILLYMIIFGTIMRISRFNPPVYILGRKYFYGRFNTSMHLTEVLVLFDVSVLHIRTLKVEGEGVGVNWHLAKSFSDKRRQRELFAFSQTERRRWNHSNQTMNRYYRSRYQIRSFRCFRLRLSNYTLLFALMFRLLAVSEWIFWQNRDRRTVKMKEAYLVFSLRLKFCSDETSWTFSEKGDWSSRNFSRENTSYQDLLLIPFLYSLSCWIDL